MTLSLRYISSFVFHFSTRDGGSPPPFLMSEQPNLLNGSSVFRRFFVSFPSHCDFINSLFPFAMSAQPNLPNHNNVCVSFLKTLSSAFRSTFSPSFFGILACAAGCSYFFMLNLVSLAILYRDITTLNFDSILVFLRFTKVYTIYFCFSAAFLIFYNLEAWKVLNLSFSQLALILLTDFIVSGVVLSIFFLVCYVAYVYAFVIYHTFLPYLGFITGLSKWW
jgi:hypothetical protein